MNLKKMQSKIILLSNTDELLAFSNILKQECVVHSLNNTDNVPIYYCFERKVFGGLELRSGGFNIVSFEWFRDNYKSTNDEKVYYKGDKNRGDEIIKALENLGGTNTYGSKGNIESNYYYIDKDGLIAYATEVGETFFFMKQLYKQVYLPNLVLEEYNGKFYRKQDFDKAISILPEWKN